MTQTKAQLIGNVVGNVTISGVTTSTGGFVGNLTGTATTATTVNILNTNGLTTVYYPTFVESRTDGQIVRADVDLTYRTDTNTLTAPNVSATSFVGTLTGNATGLSGTPNITVGIATANTELDVGIGGTVLTAFSSTGRIGLGTANPVSKLDLFGASTQSVITLAASDINCSLGNYFIDTVNGSKTYTVSSVPSSRAYSFTLEVTHTTGTITWFGNLEWPGGTAPTLTTGKTHLFMFITDDGGSRWRGSSLINYTN